MTHMRKGTALPIVVMILAVVAALAMLTFSLKTTNTWPFAKGKIRVSNTNVTNTTNTSTTNTNVSVNTHAAANTNNTNAPATTPDGGVVTKSPTDGWMRYENTTYGFSFDYPDGYNAPVNASRDTRPSFTLNGDGSLSAHGTITPSFLASFDPKKEHEYPGFMVGVFPLAAWSYVDTPGATTYIYHTATKNIWKVDGSTATEKVQDALLRTTPTGDGEAFITGTGDMGGSTKTFLLVQPSAQRMVEISFDQSVPLDQAAPATQNIDIWQSILPAFYMTDRLAPTMKHLVSSSGLVGIGYPKSLTLTKATANLNGAYEAYTVTPQGTSPYVESLSLYRPESITPDETSCAKAGAKCTGFHPTMALYTALNKAYDASDSMAAYTRLYLGDAKYLVGKTTAANGGTIRQYIKFVGTTMVVLNVYNYPTTDTKADVLVAPWQFSYAGF